MMKNSLLFFVLSVVLAGLTFGQNKCFTGEEAKKVVESNKSNSNAVKNKAIRKELVRMSEDKSEYRLSRSKFGKTD